MNKKLTKLLSVFLIAGLIGTGTAVGIAGCKKDNTTKPTNNQTEQNITWNMKDHGTKPSDAAAKTSGGKVTKPQVDPTDDDYSFGGWFSDDACTTAFDFNKVHTGPVTVYAKWTPKTASGEGIDITKEFAQADYDAATEASGKKYLEIGSEIVTGVSVAGVADLEIESNSKKIIYDGAEKAVGYRVKFGADLYTAKAASGDTEAYNELKRGLKVEVAEDATLVIYGTAGTSGKTAYISIAEGVTEGEVTKLTIKDTQQVCYNNEVNAAIFEVKAGKTYYVGSDTITAGDSNAANANIYYLEIKSDFDEGKGEKNAAKDANCVDKGNVAYYYTKYGRYLDEAGEVLSPNEVFTAALGHKWTYTEVTNPSATEPGSVTLTCGRDSQHTEIVTLPVLKSTLYERTEITEGENAGKYTYSFKYLNVYEGEEQVDVITFVEDFVKSAEMQFVDISGIEYEEDEGDYIASASSTPKAVGNGLLKLTAGTNNGGEMGSDKSLNVVFADGKISMNDSESANILYGVLGFDEAKTSGVYRVSGKLNALAAGNWDPVQIVNSTDISSAQDEKIVFALSSGGNKKYCMRFDGVRRAESAFSVNDSTNYLFRLDIDLDNHIATISLSEDGEEWAEIDTVTDPSINTFAGIRFQTGSGSRTFSVEQIMVSEQMEVPAVAGDYELIGREYNLGVSSFVTNSAKKLKISATNTFTNTVYGISGTWEQEDGKSYYTCAYEVGGQTYKMYVEFDEENGVIYTYNAEADIAGKAFYQVYVKSGTQLSDAVKTVLDAANYEKIEAGERENPIVITELSATAITATGLEKSNEVFYTYKNTGDEAVQITVVAGDNTTMYKVTPVADGWSFANITESFQVAAGETILIAAAAEEDGGISFVFRAYDANTDGAVKYDISFDTGDESDEVVGMVKTGEDGKLADLPGLDDNAFYTFKGWYMLDKAGAKVDVDADTVYTENTTLHAKWEAKGTIVAAQNNTFTYDGFSELGLLADAGVVTQNVLNGTDGAWLTPDNSGSNTFTFRGTGNNRFELTYGGLKVYFGAAGTLTLKVRSTGNSNSSIVGLKNAAGDYVAATSIQSADPDPNKANIWEALTSNTAAGVSTDVPNAYIVKGSNAATINYTITEAGWYTVYSDKDQSGFGRAVGITEVSRTVEQYVINGAFTQTSVELSKTETTIDEQKNDKINPTITTDTNNGIYAETVEWSSEDDTVATVENGVITVLKKGESDTVVITCTVVDNLGNEVRKTVTVTVNHVAATGVSITTAADNTLVVGSTKQLEYAVAVDGEGAATDVAEIEWISDDETVAEVSETGLVTVVDAGDANITVKITTLDGEEFTSNAYAISIASIKATSLGDMTAVSIAVNQTVTLNPVVGPEGASGYTLSYEVTEGTAATVDETTGVVTGVEEGTATITVTLDDGDDQTYTKTCAVTVAGTLYRFVQGTTTVSEDSTPWKSYGGTLGTATPSAGDNPGYTGGNGLKIESDKGLQLVATGSKATITLKAFSTATSNEMKAKAQFLNASGEVINTLEITLSKSAKTIQTVSGTLELDAGAEFAAIKFVIGAQTANGNAAHWSLLEANVTVS